MNIWIPKKHDIERILREMADKIRDVDEIREIETYLDDTLSALDCHVTNRANVERGEIKEA